MTRLIVLDTETSGLTPPVGVCECGYVELDHTLTEIDRAHSLIDPEVPISASASGVHRITNDMVQDAPTLTEWFEIVLKNPFEGCEQLVFVAHNADFDFPLVKDKLPEGTLVLCTLKLARRFYPEAENHKLATLKYMFNLGTGGHSHSAMADVEDTADLLRKMVSESGMSIAELLEFQYKPRKIDIMPFSKDHKGKKLEDVPKSFWQWLERQKGGVDPDLAYSVNLIHPDLFKPKV